MNEITQIWAVLVDQDGVEQIAATMEAPGVSSPLLSYRPEDVSKLKVWADHVASAFNSTSRLVTFTKRCEVESFTPSGENDR